ncbi:sugar transferase [Aurantimonas coralicida]|uniref:sugar transferase n=1 Tax=Aurantimonas coralicida TaxID=182270 RepID=UPI00245575E3|nr:sugar transferase [Aurantimonas coralicida]
MALGGTLKRIFDVVVSLCAIVALFPLMIILALIIKISDKGSVFYCHPRIGFRGAQFGCLKFRTMREDSDLCLAELLRENPDARREWDASCKLKCDPRITFVGSVLRRTSLDELPQLINVLRGEMSLVGPRPVIADELALYGAHKSMYLAVRPGLTGQWQASGRSDVGYEQRVALDVGYVTNWSLAADLKIILKTVPVLFSRRGAY